ncbi:MAG: YihY/virulence factor BrkB family protein [Campylobacterota bacterium]|nr:YihY/virulence factor BrkB family protein [Campylobacterota bacterium]
MNIVPQHPLRTIFSAIKAFFDDDTTYYAASLSFFTIFSFLPILALSIVFISYFNVLTPYTNTFMNFVVENLDPTHSEQFSTLISGFLSNTNSLGSLGIGYMLFIFIMFFKDYEYIISKLHHTKKRPIYIAFILYLIVLLVLPLMFATFIYILKLYDHYVLNLIITYSSMWLFFIIVFKVSVNKKTYFKPLVLSSLATMITLSITKNLFIFYIMVNKTYSTIYGSFSTALFFFLWIYISWVIYLYGMKIFHTLNKEQQKKLLEE